ncbi:MAG: DUF1828 domain-containing protein [Lactobacillus sp.]|jgi:hypothetical protein|nr:DUF1828 domain-containing protein [Lactobacillus sp.]
MKHNEGIELTTSSTNSIGDNIRIYLLKKHDQKIRLTDDGNTLNDLTMMGVDITSPVNSQLLQAILQQYNVLADKDDVLYLDGHQEDCQTIKQTFIQALVDIDNLFYPQMFKH